MSERIRINSVEPLAIKAMLTLEGYLTKTNVSQIHKGLIRMRASQLNGCAYCLNMHIKEARAIGESDDRINALASWKESALFSKEEKTILALTEEVTLIHQSGVTNTTYQVAKERFGDQHLAQLIMTIVTINAWNRIALTTKMQDD